MAQRIGILQSFLWRGHREGKIAALIVDEAHKLSLEVLEEIRLLGNFESANEKLLRLCWWGRANSTACSPREPEAIQAANFHTSGDGAILREAEIEPYIRYRWMKAGRAGSRRFPRVP